MELPAYRRTCHAPKRERLSSAADVGGWPAAEVMLVTRSRDRNHRAYEGSDHPGVRGRTGDHCMACPEEVEPMWPCPGTGDRLPSGARPAPAGADSLGRADRGEDRRDRTAHGAAGGSGTRLS